jgi:uncharacterized membrane protein
MGGTVVAHAWCWPCALELEEVVNQKSPSHASAPQSDPSRSHATVEKLLALRARQELRVDVHQRFVERVTRALGRPLMVYAELVVVAAWIAYNSAADPNGWPLFDPPPFGRLQTGVGIAALVVTTMVLTTQNRQERLNEQRAHLDLQINLLSERKIAKLVELVEELRRDLPEVHDRKDAVAEAMTRPADPDAILAAFEDNLAAPDGSREDDQGPKG